MLSTVLALNLILIGKANRLTPLSVTSNISDYGFERNEDGACVAHEEHVPVRWEV